MLFSTKSVFHTEDELLRFLTNTSLNSDGPVAIVAGHFMLMYDDQLQSLVPMIWSDSTNPRVRHFSQQMAGNFPALTFRSGLTLWNAITSSRGSAGLALVVNDHIFQTPGWEQQNMPKSTSRLPGSLRKQFYRTADPVPDSFKALLASLPSSTSAEVLLRNDDPKRSDEDILPRETHYFSEQNLRRKFDQRTRKRLLAMEGFSQIEESKGKYRVYFTDTLLGSRLCLSDSNGCGCSGETVELLLQLAKRGFRSVVIFCPEECGVAVRAGAAVASAVSGHNGSPITIHTLTGYGGMGTSEERSESQYVVASTGDVTS